MHAFDFEMWRVICAALCVLACVEGDGDRREQDYWFSTGPWSLSWDSDELTRVRELHRRSFDDPEAFSKADDLASYLGLSLIDGIHLPIPVNVLLIGFDDASDDPSDKHPGVEIRPDEIQEWFSMLDHVVPHTRVPLSEVSCKEDGYCVDFEAVRKPKPLHSYVHYNISVHAIDVTRELSQAFRSTLKALSRKVMHEDAPDYMNQVDATALESVVDGMLAELGILWSYNVVLVNPGRERHHVYRAGFSKEEIDYLLSHPSEMAKLQKAAERFKSRLPMVPGAMLVDRMWHPGRKPGKFDVNYLMHESARWAQQMETWLKQRAKLLEDLPNDLQDVKDYVSMKGIHADADLSDLINRLIKNQAHRSEMKTDDIRILEPEEGCPVDMWAGHRRWILMDHGAMHLEWGPFVGGDGMKTTSTLPTIHDYFYTDPTHDSDATNSNRLKEQLKTQREKQLEEMRAYRVEGYVPKDVLREMEADLLERFQAEHCAHAVRPPFICQHVDMALTKLANNEDVFLSDKGEDVFMEWFGMDEEVDEVELEHTGRMKDLFLAHASATVSKALRHIFIPPTLTWHHNNSEDVDFSTPYAKSVTFRVYLMMDAARDLTKPRRPFDTEKLKQELMGLKLSTQDFQFVIHHINILEDPVLSTTLAASLRSTSLETLHSENRFRSEERLYFDSAELQQLLSKHLFRGEAPSRKTTTEGLHTQLDVPIFVLILDRDRPVFVDRHYLARAMEDMVIVVQNSQHRGQHPLGITCGDAVMGQTLSAPLKATLAAVLQHLGGLLPPHLGYSPEHRAIAHDWTWSIGANPFSLTSPGWKISQPQRDALHRTYILDSVDLSIEMVNHGIRLLQGVSPSDRSFDFVKSHAGEFRQLLKDYATLVELWRRVMGEAGNRDFHKATAKLPTIESLAEQFLSTAQAIEHEVEPLTCLQTRSPYFGVSWLTEEFLALALFLVVSVVSYRVLPKRRLKTRRQ